MANPLSDLLALGRAPAGLVGDLHAIAEAVRSVPRIERMLSTLLPGLDNVFSDVEQLRSIVGPQESRVEHIEQMVERIEQRTVVLERAVLDLKAIADQAMEHLPDPDDDRGAIAKAKDAITGS